MQDTFFRSVRRVLVESLIVSNIFFAPIFSKVPMIANRPAYFPDGTHFEALVTAVCQTKGPILELGCSDYSTPLLHAICSKSHRFILSADDNIVRFANFLDLKRPWHSFVMVDRHDNWLNVGCDAHWSVAIIDHFVHCGNTDIKRLREKVDIFVVHGGGDDLEQVKLLSTFKYHHKCNRFDVATAVVSDILDVEKFF